MKVIETHSKGSRKLLDILKKEIQDKKERHQAYVERYKKGDVVLR